jgi:hypothetical protein
MTKEKNIFETAANRLSKKKQEPKVAKPKSIHPFKHNKDPETEEMLKKMKDMKEDLKNKIDLIKNKNSAEAKQFKKMLENPSNFSKKEWNDIQKAKKLLGDKIWQAIGKPETPEEGLQSSPSNPMNRKAKTLGSRKKWIPMR